MVFKIPIQAKILKIRINLNKRIFKQKKGERQYRHT